MEEIRALLEKCNIAPETIDRICEAMVKFRNTIKEEMDRKFEDRLAKAKKVCLEEIQVYENELARRLQIFCESKSEAIERVKAKDMAAREGEAAALLTRVKGLLEGISIQDETGLRKQVKKLATENRQMADQVRKAQLQANRNSEIARRALARNRLLEMRTTTVTEVPVTESTERNTPPARKPYRANAATPSSTRPTLIENQRRGQPVVESNGGRGQSVGALTPEAIAAELDEVE